ncbi:MAG TPA: cytochrome c [Thermoanaerobaculia bacterium]|jgi:mono/diheme cytochrome c family protein
MKFLLGILSALLILGVVGTAALLTGSFNTAAVVPPGALEKKLAGLALDNSASRRAPKISNPLKPSPGVLQKGLGGYKEMCLLCHAAPGVDVSEIGAGLNPPAPDLTLPKVQKRTDGELFWIIQNGVRMTGMPAFGPTHEDEAIWHMVTFVRHLPELTPKEEKFLKAGEAGEHEHEAAEAPHVH